MCVPAHLRRFPTRQAIDALALRFDLPNYPDMQDWAWEVADPLRLDEFLYAYESGDLNEDERFVLMEIILQSFEDLERSSNLVDPRWPSVLDILDRNIDLHAYSVWYWSVLDREWDDEIFWVTPHVREILPKHRQRLEKPLIG